MAILAHVGPPRQGKTMHAIAGPVIDALGAGQVVCGNIEGWGDPARVEKLRQLVVKRKGKPADFAIDVRFIPHSVLVSSGDVFPVDLGREDEDGTRLYDDSGSLVPFGALLVWDEAKAFTTDHMHKAAKDIVAYHGHWGTDKHPFNILLIYQHWAGFAPIVRANVEKVSHFKKSSGRKITRWTVENPGDVSKLPLNKVTTIRDTLKIDPEIGECYKSTRADVVADDNVKTSFWNTPFFKKWRKIIVVGLILATVAQVFLVRWFMAKNNIHLPGGGSAAPAVGGQAGPAGPAVSFSEPVIIGVLPSAQGYGFSVLVRDGDGTEIVSGDGFTGVGEAMTGQYKGQKIKWRGSY
jgi:zona occludens toxin (predicted ATPase)